MKADDPAFPRGTKWRLDGGIAQQGARGLTIRAEFAKEAMKAILTFDSSGLDVDHVRARVAKRAVLMADALIEELNKEKP